jgi:hypothetical protein
VRRFERGNLKNNGQSPYPYATSLLLIRWLKLLRSAPRGPSPLRHGAQGGASYQFEPRSAVENEDDNEQDAEGEEEADYYDKDVDNQNFAKTDTRTSRTTNNQDDQEDEDETEDEEDALDAANLAAKRRRVDPDDADDDDDE